MMPGRYLATEVLRRMREAEQEARKMQGHYPECYKFWYARARAFDEVYTDIKGLKLDSKTV